MRGEFGAREHLHVIRQETAQFACDQIRVGAGLQRDKTVIDLLGPPVREYAEEIGLIRQHDAEPKKPGAEHIIAADGHAAAVKLDDAAGLQRPEQRARLAVDEHGVGPVEHGGLVLDFGDGERPRLRVEAEHRDVEPQPAARVLPFGAAEIERARLRHPGVAPGLDKALPRELPGFRLEDVFVRGDQKIKPHVVVNQHAALRYRDEKTELDKDQQDGNEDAAKRQRGAALLMRKNAPGNVQRHDPGFPCAFVRRVREGCL